MFIIPLLIFVAGTNADTEDSKLVRRLSGSSNSFPAECKVFAANSAANAMGHGLPANPSSTDIALVITDSDSHLSPMNSDAAGKHHHGDMSTAKSWCQARFGEDSYPIFPEDAAHFTAMTNICDHFNEDCFFGLVRKTDRDHDVIADCDQWVAYDGRTTVNSHDTTLYKKWYTGNRNKVQPTCNQLDSEHPQFDAGENKQCVGYRPSDGLYVEQCKKKVVILCKWTGSFSPTQS